MTKEIIVINLWSDAGHYPNMMDQILEAKPNTHIIIAGGQEYDLMGQPSDIFNNVEQLALRSYVKSRCQENNIQIDLITSLTDHDMKHVCSRHGVAFWSSVFNIISVPHFWMLYSLDINYYGSGLIPFVNHEYEHFNKLFVTLNGTPHYERCFAMDYLAREDVINKNNVITWCSMKTEFNDYPYQFKYWIPELLMFEPPESLRCTNVTSAPAGYEECLFDFVSESQTDCQFWTEKTVRPILCRKPFLIYGQPNSNTGLKLFGFELFDEVFDYGFDCLPTYEERFRGAYEQIMQYNDLTDDELMDMYNLLKPKIEHNYQILKNMPNNQSNPEQLLLAYPSLLSSHDTAFSVHYADK